VDNEDEQQNYSTVQDTKPFAINSKDTIFGEIIGYSDIKQEFAKALDSSSPVSILLCGPSECGKSELLKQIGEHFEDESLFIDGSYGSKAGIFEMLHKNIPKYVLLDEIDKLSSQHQQALLNLIEGGRLTKTTKLDSYDIKLDVWVFATANNEQKLLEPLLKNLKSTFWQNLQIMSLEGLWLTDSGKKEYKMRNSPYISQTQCKEVLIGKMSETLSELPESQRLSKM
jgi:holliday junction DNA helicase RuvB